MPNEEETKKEIEVKLPAKLSIVGAAFALIGFKL